MNTTAIVTLITAMLGAMPSGENLSLDQVLAKYDAAQQRLRKCTVNVQERWLIKRVDATQLLSTRSYSVRLDGVRANLLIKEMSYPPDTATPVAETFGHVNEFNYVCADQALEIYFPHGDDGVRPALPSAVIGRLSRGEKDEFFVQNALGSSAVAFGQTTFLTTIPVVKLISLFKNCLVTRDESGYCVNGTTPDGTRHKIWFDPQSSFVIRRQTFEQSGETLNDNRFQFNREVLKSKYAFPERAVVNSVRYELRTTIGPWRDTHVITAVEAIKTIAATDGSTATEHVSHTLTDWNLDPDFSDASSFRPLLPLPTVARTQVQDTPSLEYIYKDGKIELTIHKGTVRELENVRLPGRPTAPRVQWIWAAVSAVLATAWWRLRALAG